MIYDDNKDISNNLLIGGKKKIRLNLTTNKIDELLDLHAKTVDLNFYALSLYYWLITQIALIVQNC